MPMICNRINNLGENNKIIVGTHDGRMHLDDVLSVALIKMHTSEDKIIEVIRSRESSQLSKCDIILDVGNGLSGLDGKLIFDHHNRDDTYSNGIRKCSCAMLLDLMFEDTSKNMQNWYYFLLNEWVYGVSAADCGQKASDYGAKPNFNNFVTLMNPTIIEMEQPGFEMEMFNEAVNTCLTFLNRYFRHFSANQNILSYFENEIVNYKGNGIVFLPMVDTKRIMHYNKLVPASKKIVVCVSYDIKFGKYAVYTMPINCSTEEHMVYHPVEWRNQNQDRIKELTGVENVYIIHNNGKYSLHFTYAAAFSIAQKLKEIYDHQNHN